MDQAQGRRPLSPREREIATLVGRCLSNKQIGRALCLSRFTVKNAVAQIFEKLGVQNRQEIVVWALATGQVVLADVWQEISQRTAALDEARGCEEIETEGETHAG